MSSFRPRHYETISLLMLSLQTEIPPLLCIPFFHRQKSVNEEFQSDILIFFLLNSSKSLKNVLTD